MRHYKKYDVWRRAHRIVLATYELSSELPAAERYELAAQMKRAAVSISSNIAEGAGRGSDADFRRFLLMANGSANELESQVLAVHDLNLASPPNAQQLLGQINRVRRGLIRLIRSTE
jgi:four helix bundle protein